MGEYRHMVRPLLSDGGVPTPSGHAASASWFERDARLAANAASHDPMPRTEHQRGEVTFAPRSPHDCASPGAVIAVGGRQPSQKRYEEIIRP